MSENTSQNGRKPEMKPSPPLLKRNGEITPSSSPRIRRRDGATPPTTHIIHATRTICSTLWGQKLSFHSYVTGDPLVPFPSLWPDKQTLVDTYKTAELDKYPYEFCKLLLATNSHKSLDALLEDRALPVDCSFKGDGCTLAHLACALGLSDVVQVLLKRSQSNNLIWTQKDTEKRTPDEVCIKAELRRILPSSRALFSARKRVLQGQPLKPEDRKLIFELAEKPDAFYRLIVMLNSFSFNVNDERNNDGDLLIHVAIKGGLPQLPLLFILVNSFKADICLKDRAGVTPLSLAVQLGHETLVEVLICVFGADVNAPSTSDELPPLHIAVNSTHPRIVSILLRRGADACREDKNMCIPSFLARKQRAYECRQIISQHLKERMQRLCRDTISGSLNVNQLYPSDLCAVSENGCTLLMLAAIHNQDHLMRDMLKKGDCPLDFMQMKSCDLVDSLTDSMETSWCESSEDADHSMKTAVHFAAEKGNLRCLQILLNAHAHPATKDSSGLLPLHYAVDRGHIECVKAILAYPNHLGLSELKPALDISRGNEFTEITAVLEQAYQRRQSGLITPLLFAVANSGHKENIIHVLQNGDNVNPENESHDWPLLLAAGYGYDSLVKLLHQFGGHITRRHRTSRSTPLHVAARGGHTKVVQYLLQFCRVEEGPMDTSLPSGVMEDEDAQFIDINGKNSMRATPLELAASQGHTEVVKLLLEHRASTTLPDSNGRLVSCSSFAGTQFLLETHRKEHRRAIIDCLRSRCVLKTFRQCWQGPSDFNLFAKNGDSMIMVAAQFAQPEVLRYLLEQAEAIKPSMLISGDQSPHVQSSLTSSRSEDSSDSSLPAMHLGAKSDSVKERGDTTHQHQKFYEVDSDERGRHTALPFPFKPPQTREERLTASGGSAPSKNPPRAASRVSHKPPRRASTNATVSSSEDDDPTKYRRVVSGRNGARARDHSSENDQMEPHTYLIEYANPMDGQTALHRATSASQFNNITVLLDRDEELANIRDNDGNTALHLACNKADKRTVTTLLKYQCVMTTLRNAKNELPEHGCLKSAIKKLVCKARQARAGTELQLPDPPNSMWSGPGITPSMERNIGAIPPYVGNPPGGQLSAIQETSPRSSVLSDPSLTYLNDRLRDMKLKMNTPCAEEPIVSN